MTSPRTVKILLATIAALCLGIVGFGIAGYVRLNAMMDRIDYAARVVEVRPSQSCVDYLEGMGGLVERVAGKIGKLPFDIIFGDPPATPDAGSIDAGAADASADDADRLTDASPDPAPDKDQDDGQGDEDEDTFAGEDCSAVVEVEVEIVNPMPLPTTMRITHVDGSLSGEAITTDQITWNHEAVAIEAHEAIVQELTLNFHLGQLVAAGGGLLLRNKVSIVANAVVEVTILGGLVKRRLELHVERKLTLDDVVHGVSGSLEPNELPEEDAPDDEANAP